jgi:hypothetical protein
MSAIIQFPAWPRALAIEGGHAELINPYGFNLPRTGVSGVIPVGFITDWASIPRIMWAIFPPTGPYAAAALIHDWLYYSGYVSRRQADKAFAEAMQILGIPAWQRALFYASVRIGGRGGYSYRIQDPTAADLLPSTGPILSSRAWQSQGLLLGPRRNQPYLTIEKRYHPGVIRNQGATPKCAGYAAANAAEILGVDIDPVETYWEAKLHDGYPRLPGTTLVAIQKAHTIIHDDEEFVVERGPVLIGLDWKTGMANPNPTSHYVRPRGQSYGGHAVTLIANLPKRKAFQLENSHGRYGFRGTAFIKWADLPRATLPGEHLVALGYRRKRRH